MKFYCTFGKRAWKAQTLHAITPYDHYIFPNGIKLRIYQDSFYKIKHSSFHGSG
jgi:hypothetical protein